MSLLIDLPTKYLGLTRRTAMPCPAGNLAPTYMPALSHGLDLRSAQNDSFQGAFL